MFETSDECNRFRSGRFSNRAKLGFSASLTVPMWVRRTLTEEESGRLSRRLKEDLSKNPVKAAEEQTLKADNIKRLIGEVNLVEGKTTDQALIAVASGVHDALLKREAARSAAEKAFSGEPLEGVGGEVWRTLWNSARLYSMQIAYPGQPFPKAVDLTEEAMQAQGHLLLNANLATLFTVVGLNGKSSTGKMTSGQATSADHAFIEIFPEENPSLADGMRSVDSNQMAGLSPFTWK